MFIILGVRLSNVPYYAYLSVNAGVNLFLLLSDGKKPLKLQK